MLGLHTVYLYFHSLLYLVIYNCTTFIFIKIRIYIYCKHMFIHTNSQRLVAYKILL